MPRPRTRQYVTFEGRDYALDKDGYWKIPTTRGVKQRQLHRDVWASVHGPIPEGWHIHHLDHDKSNNDVGNLRALSPGDHSREHAGRGWADWNPAVLSAWRRQEWAEREAAARRCLNCGGEFFSTGQRAKYCDPTCREAYNRTKRLEQAKARYDPAERRAKHERAQRRARERAAGAGV